MKNDGQTRKQRKKENQMILMVLEEVIKKALELIVDKATTECENSIWFSPNKNIRRKQIMGSILYNEDNKEWESFSSMTKTMMLKKKDFSEELVKSALIFAKKGLKQKYSKEEKGGQSV